jgi:hypothetical protein
MFHSSDSDSEDHLTVRGFVDGRGRFTIHVDSDGELRGFYRNAGRWTNTTLCVHEDCEEI